ncbi:site-specific integrase [Myxococcota bacterium]|nr:site-specific integrase [Myxococcota bacterium]
MTKRQSYWFRRRVPTDLVDKLGKEFTRPLNTKIRRRAEQLARVYGRELEAAFSAVRADLVNDVGDLRAWARDLAEKELRPLMSRDDEPSDGALGLDPAETVANAFAHAFEILTGPVNAGEEWALRMALKYTGEDPDSLPREHWQRMAVMALRAAQSLGLDAHPLAERAIRPPPAKLKASGELAAIARQLAAINAKVEAQGKANDEKTFGSALSLYAKVKAEMRSESITDTMADDLYRIPARFADFVGLDVKLDQVKTEHVLAWLDAQCDQRAKVPKAISVGTRNRFVGSISTFYDVAVTRGWALRNPAKGLRKGRRTKSYERREAFSLGDLHKLFTLDLQAEVKRGFPERWWVPCLMLMNATRTNEVCQLRLRDVVEIDGIPCLRILPEDATQSTKTEESDRVIPLHPQVIDLGFLDYIEERREATGNDPAAQVFPNLTYRRRGGYKSKVVGFFAGEKGYLERIGIREDMRKTLYSLRHTSITAMERAGVKDLARAQLTGHARQGDQGRLTYISDREARELMQELSKVDWNEALRGLG